MKTPINILLKGEQQLNKVIKNTLKSILPELETIKAKGKQIFTIDGSLRATAIHLKECIETAKRFDNTTYPLGYIHLSYGGCICITFKICLSGGSYDDNTHYCEYFEKTIYIGKETSKGITELDTFENLSTGYKLDKKVNLNSQLKKVEKYKAAKEKLEKMLFDIEPNIQSHFYLK